MLSISTKLTMSLCGPESRQEGKSGPLLFPEWADPCCFWVAIFWLPALSLKLLYVFLFTFFSLELWSMHILTVLSCNLAISSEVGGDMQWGCAKTRCEEQLDRQLRSWVGGRKRLGDAGHRQKAGRHGTGPPGNCTLWSRSWRPGRTLDVAFDVRLEATESSPTQGRRKRLVHLWIRTGGCLNVGILILNRILP